VKPVVSIIGCGWLGLPCAQKLVSEGYQVKGSTTSAEKISVLKESHIEAHLCNLDKDLIPAPFLECDILFINFPPGRGADNLLSRYQKRIAKVIQAAKQSEVQKIIFASTTGVYSGDESNEIVDESSTPKPKRTSAQAMYEAEQSLSQYTKQLTILRFAGLVGGGRKASSFMAGKTNLPNPDNAINLVHLEDCVSVFHHIVEHNIFGQVFNVVSDHHPTRKDFYTTQTLKANLVPPTFSDQTTSPNKIVSNAKLKKELNYEFLHPDPYLFP